MIAELEKITNEEVIEAYRELNTMVSIQNILDGMAMDGTWPTYDIETSNKLYDLREIVSRGGQKTIERIIGGLGKYDLPHYFESQMLIEAKYKYGKNFSGLELDQIKEAVGNIRVGSFNDVCSSAVPYQRAFLAVIRELIPDGHQKKTFMIYGEPI